jgi:hypothetical protein
MNRKQRSARLPRWQRFRTNSCTSGPAPRLPPSPRGADVTFQNRLVHFRIRDVYYPEPQNVLAELHGDDLLQGRVIDVTDNQGREGAYAVIQVDGLEKPLIVAITRIMGAV